MSNFGFSISDLLILNFLITTWERAARAPAKGVKIIQYKDLGW